MTKKGAVEPIQKEHRDLEKSLRSAVKEPKHIHTNDGGAILALCVHCKSSIGPPQYSPKCLICSKMRSLLRRIPCLCGREQDSRAMTIIVCINVAYKCQSLTTMHGNFTTAALKSPSLRHGRDGKCRVSCRHCCRLWLRGAFRQAARVLPIRSSNRLERQI